MRRFLLALVLAAGPVSLRAQLPAIVPAGSYWMDPWYPKLFWSPRTGLNVGARYALVAPLRYADYDVAAPNRIALALDGQLSTSGTRFLKFDAWAPAWIDGWRLRLSASTERWNRAGWYGVGNDSPYDGANRDLDPFFYRARHRRTYLRTEVQRRVVGPLRLLVGTHAERWRLDPLTATSVLGQLQTADPAQPIGVHRTDVALRAGLVIDSRDSETMPRRGVLIEAIRAFADADMAGDETYTRTYVSARSYVTLSERWGVSARLAGQHMGGSPTLGTLYLVDESDQPVLGFGGAAVHRGLFDDRLLGRDKLWGNVDLQYTAFEVPTLTRLVLIAFVDAGRVFDIENLRLTTQDLHVAVGGGFMLHPPLTQAVLGTTVAAGPDGLTVQFHSSWAY